MAKPFLIIGSDKIIWKNIQGRRTTRSANTDTERDSVVLYKYDKNGNQLATVNRYEIPNDKKDSAYIDIDVTLGTTG